MNQAPPPTIEPERIAGRYRWYIYLNAQPTSMGPIRRVQYLLDRIRSRNYHVYPAREAIAPQPPGFYFEVLTEKNTANDIHNVAFIVAQLVVLDFKLERTSDQSIELRAL